MYVDHFPKLTFEDMVYATQRSAGLGQVPDDINAMSVQNPGEQLGSQNIDPYDLMLSSIAQGGATVTTGGVAASQTVTSWTTIALIAAAVVGGVFVIKGIAR